MKVKYLKNITFYIMAFQVHIVFGHFGWNVDETRD
jgi:hypothetical protein